MSVHLVNPSDNSFGTAVITPRWLFVLAAATPPAAGDPIVVDESLEQIVPESIMSGDIVGISVWTIGQSLRLRLQKSGSDRRRNKRNKQNPPDNGGFLIGDELENDTI
jgi:hypothetical protein